MKTEYANSVDEKEKVALLNKISYNFRRINSDSVLLYAQKALRLASQVEDLAGLAYAYKNKGMGYFRQSRFPDSVQFFYQKGISVGMQARAYETVAGCYNNIALTHLWKMEKEKAKGLLLKGLEILNENLGKDTRIEALILANLGLTHFSVNDYDACGAYFARSFDMADRINDLTIRTTYIDEFAGYLKKIGKIDSAYYELDRILPLVDKIGDTQTEIDILFFYTRIAYDDKEYEKSFEKASEGARKAHARKLFRREIQFINHMAEASMAMGNYALACNLGEEAFDKAQKLKENAISVKLFSLKILSEAYAKQGDFQKAFEYGRLEIEETKTSMKLENKIAMDKQEAAFKMKQDEALIKSLNEISDLQQRRIRTLIITSLALLSLFIIAIILYNQKINTTVLLEAKNKDLELIEAELNHRNEELNEYIATNMQLENFAYLASHDLQEPVTNVIGFTQLLEKNYAHQMDENGLRSIKYIKASSQRMQNLISDLLSYSIVGKHKNYEEIDLNSLIHEVKADLNQVIMESKAHIHINQMPSLLANRSELSMLFQNLVSNGIKYRKKNVAPEIYIEAKEEGKNWHFSVSDNGIGIASEHQETIFAMFKRLSYEGKYTGKSTGIGLATCKRIVESHQGKIWVDSAPGEGSCFHFTLPQKVN